MCCRQVRAPHVLLHVKVHHCAALSLVQLSQAFSTLQLARRNNFEPAFTAGVRLASLWPLHTSHDPHAVGRIADPMYPSQIP